jgi:glucose/arabinose dehydrogenase
MGGTDMGGAGMGGTGMGGAGMGGAGMGGAGMGGAGMGGAGMGGAGMGGAGGTTSRQNTCQFPAQSALANAALPAGYCAVTWATNLASPRGILVDDEGDVIVVARGSNPATAPNAQIVLLHDDNANGISDASERVTLVSQAGLHHGIALSAGYLYASSTTTVYRWPYSGNRQPLGSAQQVVTGLPSGGNHYTRTLLFDAQGRLYVSIGSASNVDANSNRSRMLRFTTSQLAAGATMAQGEVFADGLRNEVGITLDGQGRVWGVENGRDLLSRSDFSGDIGENNPGEELNLFLEANAGRFYGYPYCWSEFNLPNGLGAGTQWADPTFMNDGTHTDAWCRNTSNVLPPVLVMQGHSAPLDVKFYTGGSFPNDVVGDALVTFHGSWDRSTATGYKVVRVPFGNDGMPSGAPVPLLESANPGDTDDQWPHRPVGLGVGDRGQVFVTSDASGVIVAIGHDGS